MALSKIQPRGEVWHGPRWPHAKFGEDWTKFRTSLCLKTRTVGINYGVGIGHIYRFLASLLHFVSQLRCEIINMVR